MKMKKYPQSNPKYQKGSVASLLVILVVLIVAGIIVFALKFAAENYTKNQNSMATTSTLTSTPTPITNSNSPSLTIDQVMNATLPDFTSDTPQSASMTLVNGKFNGMVSSSTYDVALRTASSTLAYGDLNGDGAPDMAVTIDANTGGSGVFTFLLVFLNNSGQPQYVASQLLGDRITVNGVSIVNGIITVNIITQGPGEPMCCGTMPETVKYGLKGGSLLEVTNNGSMGTISQSSIGQSAVDANGNALPNITSISPSSGPVGTTLEIKGTDLAGFEGDLDAWIQNVKTGEVGFLPGIGSVPRADQTIRVKITSQVCKTNNGYKGGPCDSFMTIRPGTYNIYTVPWNKKSNEVKFTVTN